VHAILTTALATLNWGLDLLALPIAIRRNIYALLLVDYEAVSFLPEFLDECSTQIWPEETELYAALLRVNKQVYDEAVAVLYSDNRF
jgi:hypothetical protein